LTFESWWDQKKRDTSQAAPLDAKGQAKQAWTAATAKERERCAGIAHSMGGEIDFENPDEPMLCANSIEWEILGRPGMKEREG
jgi:hypothetical protein